MRFLPGIAALLLVAGCALFRPASPPVHWPSTIQRFDALCELTMVWSQFRHSGTMALKLDYPERLVMEVFGPFGETAAQLKKDGTDFLFVSPEERITSQRDFESALGLRLDDFIDDLAMRPPRGPRNYTVEEDSADGYRQICWEGSPGRICIRFLEVSFPQ